jgi:hypothetical protein
VGEIVKRSKIKRGEPMKRTPPRNLTPSEQQLADEFRTPGVCEGGCGTVCKRREAHHVRSRGAGGPWHRLNLLSLGTAFDCTCHESFQRYRKGFSIEDARRIIAARESVSLEEIDTTIREVMQRAKEQRY